MGTQPELLDQGLSYENQLSRNRSLRSLSNKENNILTIINDAFRNWFKPWKEAYLKDGEEFSVVYGTMETLIHYEEQILTSESVLPNERLNAIGQAVARLVDYGNAILSLDIIIRNGHDEISSELDPAGVTTVQLYRAHIKAQKLRTDLLFNYFKRGTSKRYSNDGSTTNPISPASLSSTQLQVPQLHQSLSSLPSPNLERSHKISCGSNISINSPDSNSSFLTISASDEDLSDSLQELKQITAEIKIHTAPSPQIMKSFRNLLPGILKKIENLLTMPTNQPKKLARCFELLDSILNAVERLPNESRREEVYMIANSLLKPLVRKVYINDREGLLEFQHSHWTTYLISLIRLLVASNLDSYLKNFTNSTDLNAFLRDYLFIVKRFITSKSDSSLEVQEPVYQNCWIEMNLLACATFLNSMTQLYQTIREFFASNPQMWESYIDCLINFIFHDAVRTDRELLKVRQKTCANHLRRTAAEYILIAWDSLSYDQKNQTIDKFVEPLLRCCMMLASNQRSILLPIFYDMMRCDYTSQYITPRSVAGGLTSGGSILNSFHGSTIDNLEFSSINTNYEDVFRNNYCVNFEIASQDGGDAATPTPFYRVPTSASNLSATRRQNSVESLPYLSLKDQNNSSSDDGTMLTRFTHLVVEGLYRLMVDQELGDESFQLDLCGAISGRMSLDRNNTQFTYTTQPNYPSDLNQFKHMARHTSDLVMEFMSICLDSRKAVNFSYNHLHLLCLFKMILFFRDKVDLIKLYLINLHKLWTLHHGTGRFAEAGLTLLDYAKSILWSDEPLDGNHMIIAKSLHSSEPLTTLTGFKLLLYATIIEYFDQSQIWEAAIPLCRELISIYEFKLFDYARLADILARQSQFFSNIITSGRSSGAFRTHPEYFRVTFYGNGFPDCIRDTTMVYRGKPFEKLGDFQAILLSKYSDAKLLQTLAKPDEDLLRDPEAKYLQINACTPVVDLSSRFPQASSIDKIPNPIVEYYKRNECHKFEFSRKLPLVGTSGANEFANIWREQTKLTTNSLPGMLPFFPVFLVETSIISPLECAIEDLERANDRLLSMVNRFRLDTRREEDERLLAQLVSGMVNSAVNGGIVKYEEAFFAASTQSSQYPTHTGVVGSAFMQHHQTQVPLSLSTVSNSTLDSNNEQHSNVADNTVASTSSNNNHSDNKYNNTVQPYTSLSLSIPVTDRMSNTNNQQYGANGRHSQEQLEKLKTLIARQVPLLDEAIQLHRDRASKDMMPQHEYMENSFAKLKQHVMTKYSRYLPVSYIRSKSYRRGSSNRSYRHIARSPDGSNRSISSTRLGCSGASSTDSTLTSTLKSTSSWVPRVERNSNLSDKFSVQHSSAGLNNTSTTLQDQNSNIELNSTDIPYRQLNNERRSLPSLMGVESVGVTGREDDSGHLKLTNQRRPFLLDSDISDQEQASELGKGPPMAPARFGRNRLQGAGRFDDGDVYLTPPAPPKDFLGPTEDYMIEPAAASSRKNQSAYVCMADILNRSKRISDGEVPGVGDKKELPYTRLDAKLGDHNSTNDESNEEASETSSRAESSADSSGHDQDRMIPDGDETNLVSL